MPTDADTAEGAGTVRARLRFAIAVTFGFAVGQLLAWPLAFLTPMLAATLLRMPAPMEVAAAVRLVITAVIILLMGIAIVYLVLPYPLLAVIVIVVGLALTFRLGAAGGSALTVLLLLVALLILPLVGQSSPAIANLVAGGFIVNLVLAILLGWLGFAILPPATLHQPAAANQSANQTDADRAALRMTLIVAPIAVAYLAFGWSTVLTLLFAALIAQQMSAASGMQATKAILIANMAGAAVAIIAYFMLVAVPNVPFMIALVLSMALLISGPVFAGGPTSDFSASAFSAVLVILGGSLQPLADDASLKAIDRIVQIAMAGAYIVGAYALLEMLSRDLRQRRYSLDRLRRSLAKAKNRVAKMAESLPWAQPFLARAGALLASARRSARSLFARAGTSTARIARPWSKARLCGATRHSHHDGNVER